LLLVQLGVGLRGREELIDLGCVKGGVLPERFDFGDEPRVLGLEVGDPAYKLRLLAAELARLLLGALALGGGLLVQFVDPRLGGRDPVLQELALLDLEGRLALADRCLGVLGTRGVVADREGDLEAETKQKRRAFRV